jgi:gamma-glutamyltranspeptidase/glutathione hydrolase
MVASEQELATQIGVDILKAGGNAVDAAVAVGFALAVALPNAGNIGGGGFMMVHDARSGKDIALDFREVAPGASRNMYLDAAARSSTANRSTPTTPWACPAPWHARALALGQHAAGQGHGSGDCAGGQGLPVSVTLAKTLEQEKEHGPLARHPGRFLENGAPLQTGERLVQKDLAQSLRLISQQGAKAFYEGAIAQKIVAEMAPHANALSLQDLRDYKVAEREPVRGSYRGYQIVTMPPPSSGGAHLIQILNMMERWPMNQWGADSAQSVHYMTEAMKLAYADRSSTWATRTS